MRIQFHCDQTVVLTDQSQYVRWIAHLKNKCASLHVRHIFDTKQLVQLLTKLHTPNRTKIDSYQSLTAAINAYTIQYQADYLNTAVVPPFVLLMYPTSLTMARHHTRKM
jgi:hypothetical protein